MHNNYYFLRKLSAELEAVLKDCVIAECFSQNKDELVVRFEAHNRTFYIKASLLSDFCCLSFPDSFHRARKNSVELFDSMAGEQVIRIKQYTNERSFSIVLSKDYEMLFKMHGNRSNVVLLHKNKPAALFRNHLKADMDIQGEALDKEIDWSEEAFYKNRSTLKQHYFTFGKVLWKYLDEKGFGSHPPDKQWSQIQHLRHELDNPSYYLTELNDRTILSLVPLGKIHATFTNPLQALNEFFIRYSVQTAFLQEKQRAVTRLTTQLKNTENYLQKTERKLLEIEADNHYKLWGDLIMANLNAIKPGMATILLNDFYHEGKIIEVKLKKELSGQKNAEVYYRKAKNHHIEIKKLNESIAQKKAQAADLSNQIHKLSSATDLKTVRELVATLNLNSESPKNKISLPYHEHEFMNYKIWVGKNARSNDILTLKHAYKDDLWLHAKDVAGSHVVLKYQPGKIFPKEVIERAAQLAAYHSKRKNETLCPVAYTLKKYVRKRKGDPDGVVVVDREKVIIVEPSGLQRS